MLKKLVKLLRELNEVANESPQQGEGRVVAGDVLNGLALSTVWASDMVLYETAVIDAHGVHPVERYGTVELAREGHRRWLVRVSDGLEKVTELPYELLGLPSREITLEISPAWVLPRNLFPKETA
jgi:hypothetical protein